MDLNAINDTELNKTAIARMDNTTISNSTDEDRNNTLASPPTKVFQIHIQFEQHQIQEMEPKGETTSKSIHFFPGTILFLLSFLLV